MFCKIDIRRTIRESDFLLSMLHCSGYFKQLRMFQVERSSNLRLIRTSHPHSLGAFLPPPATPGRGQPRAARQLNYLPTTKIWPIGLIGPQPIVKASAGWRAQILASIIDAGLAAVWRVWRQQWVVAAIACVTVGPIPKHCSALVQVHQWPILNHLQWTSALVADTQALQWRKPKHDHTCP